MAVVPSDIEYRWSGGADNANPDLALGGVMSDFIFPSGLFNNLFDDVDNGEATAGDTEYRCFYLVNTHATDTWFTSRIWIEIETSSGDSILDIGLDPAGINGTATTIVNESTAPASVTFTHPINDAGSISIGNLTAGDFQAVWVRRIISVTAAADASDVGKLRARGSDV